MTFEQLMHNWTWKPLRHCPGRYVLQQAGRDVRPQDLLGEGGEVSEYLTDAARDAVLVAMLDGGGALLSYRRQDGSHLHTLNTPEGFERKLLQLGIDLPERLRLRSKH